ncbi:MAG: DUF4034 domain-containing protein [Gammaproteobacteria bacterium]|nr:DUF4034 domain-containing protein [Gammaproteobacteria bacterium]
MTEEVELKWISGFWRRIGALSIDTLILGAAGLALGLFLESFFVQMGGWGRMVGFSIALIYFGVMNSSITGGQTIGKKALKIRVVDSQASTISLWKSGLRYSIMAIPFSLNGAQFSNEAMLSFLMYPLSLIIFGGLFSILYLYIFNRVTRQSLHDLVVGSYVVNANVEKQEPGKVWNVHVIIVAVLFLAAAVAPVFTTQLSQSKPFKGMLAVQSALSNDPSVAYANVFTGSSTFSSTNEGTKTASYVSSLVFLQADNVNDVELARQLAIIVIASYPEALQKDTIQIILIYGYDIGIASSWSKHAHNFSPLELQGEEIDNTFGLPPADLNDWLAYKHANQDVIDTRYTKSDVVKMMRQGRFGELEHYFLAVQSDYENNKFNEHTYEVLMNSLRHDSGEVASLYGGWLKTFPDSYIAHAGRGATNSRIGWDKRGSKWSKETPEAAFQEMRRHHQLAANDLRIAVTLYPKFTWGYVDLVAMGNFGPTAMSRKHWLAKSLKYDPYNYIVRKAYISKLEPRWGGSHREMHEFALSALSYIDKNPILRGLPVYEYADKSNIFVRQERYAEAIEAGSMAIYHRPAETAYYSRAYAYQQAKNYAAAVADAEQGLKQKPDDIELLHVYAWSARDDHQYEKADDGYERLIRLRPNMATYWYSRGALQYRLKKFNTALPYLNKSYELEPSNNKYLYWSALTSVINEVPAGLVKTRTYLERCENSKCKEANVSWARRWIACVDGKPECDLPEHDYINWRE